MLNKHKTAYRIIVILIAYALIGAAIFVPISYSKPINYILLWAALGVYCAALIATIVVTEVIYAKRRKKKDGTDSQG